MKLHVYIAKLQNIPNNSILCHTFCDCLVSQSQGTLVKQPLSIVCQLANFSQWPISIPCETLNFFLSKLMALLFIIW